MQDSLKNMKHKPYVLIILKFHQFENTKRRFGLIKISSSVNMVVSHVLRGEVESVAVSTEVLHCTPTMHIDLQSWGRDCRACKKDDVISTVHVSINDLRQPAADFENDDDTVPRI